MAKYCGNCGCKWNDDVRVCGRCGAPFDDVPPYNGPNLIRRGQIRNALLVILLTAALLAGGYFGYSFVISHTGSGSIIRQTVEAYRRDDVDDMLNIASGIYDGNPETAEEFFSSQLEQVVELFQDSLGYHYTMSCDVNDKHTLSSRHMNNKLDELEERLPEFNRDDIEEIQAAEVTITAKHGEETEEETLHIYVSSENGEWRLLDIDS